MNINDFEGHFVCPECGGTYFGSTMLPDGSLVRDCHGCGTGRGCGFSWHEKDDEEYFYVSYQTVKRLLSKKKLKELGEING